MVETKSLVLENKTNQNGCKKCLSQSWVTVVKSQIFQQKFQYILASLGLIICHPW